MQVALEVMAAMDPSPGAEHAQVRDHRDHGHNWAIMEGQDHTQVGARRGTMQRGWCLVKSGPHRCTYR